MIMDREGIEEGCLISEYRKCFLLYITREGLLFEYTIGIGSPLFFSGDHRPKEDLMIW